MLSEAVTSHLGLNFALLPALLQVLINNRRLLEGRPMDDEWSGVNEFLEGRPGDNKRSGVSEFAGFLAPSQQTGGLQGTRWEGEACEEGWEEKTCLSHPQLCLGHWPHAHLRPRKDQWRKALEPPWLTLRF